MKLKDIDPLIGHTVDYYGEDHRIVSMTVRRGRKLYIGHKLGHFHTYFLDPAKVQVLNPSFN